jgi:hypothetical protein
MRKARHEINWDYYGQQKFKLKGQIEELEQQEAEEKTREQLFCNSCLAMFEEECCCNENAGCLSAKTKPDETAGN